MSGQITAAVVRQARALIADPELFARIVAIWDEATGHSTPFRYDPIEHARMLTILDRLADALEREEATDA